MSYSYITRLGDGSTNTFSINFVLGFLKREYVTCRVGEEVDGIGVPVFRTITWINDGLVSISGPAPGVDVPVVFRRTMNKQVLQHDYSDGAQIEELNLDESNLQLIMICHELLDGRIDASGIVLDPASFVSAAQLTALQDLLQGEIDALTQRVDDLQASIDQAIADAVAAAIAGVNDHVDQAIADAIAGIDIVGGGILQDRKVSVYSDPTVFSNPIPTGSTATTADGIEICSVTITPKAVGNMLTAIFTATSHSVSTSAIGVACMFINGVFAGNCYYRSANSTDSFPAGICMANIGMAGSLSPITVSIRAGTFYGSARFNDTLGGGQRATLIVDETSPAATGEAGNFVLWN